MDGNTIARSRGQLRARMSNTGPFAKAADKLEEQLTATARRALALAARHRAGDRVRADDDLNETAQGTLKGAAIGSLGCSYETAEVCDRALREWETAIRERADAEARSRGSR